MPTPVNTVEFSCTCGQKIRARLDQGGRTFKCTTCGASLRVPEVAIAAPSGGVLRSQREANDVGLPARAPASFTQLLLYLGAVWLALALLALLLLLISSILALGVILLISAVMGYQLWLMLSARQRVLTAKNVPLLWNSVRLIAWDPIEGILILRNKSVAFCDDNLEDAAGGVRLLYSVLGEELALRAPLEVQTLSFRDENVLTREYLSVTIRGAMKWRIVDLRKFYLLVSRELRSTTNQDDHESASPATSADGRGDPGADPTIRRLLRAVIGWMQVLVEEETRSVVSRARSGLLIADKLSHELFPYPAAAAATSTASGPGVSISRTLAGPDSADWGGATDGLAGAIHDTIARRLEAYGIAVEDVSLQEIRLPEKVMLECIEACRAYYFPAIAKRKATFTAEKLAAQAEVIGREAVATREVVGAAPAFTLPDFLSQYLQKRSPAPASGESTAPDVAVAAAIIDATAGSPAKQQTPAPGR